MMYDCLSVFPAAIAKRQSASRAATGLARSRRCRLQQSTEQRRSGTSQMPRFWRRENGGREQGISSALPRSARLSTESEFAA